MKKITLSTLLFFLLCQFSIAQYFPNPATLSTGQGAPGTQDPMWLCSPWSTTLPGNPMGQTYGPTLINNNCAPGAWVDPSTLAPPLNNGNWITGTESNCATNTAHGYRYFRLALNLPPDCNGNSVTVQGNYILSFDGYVDNSIIDVFINGNSQGISGGGFAPGNQLNIYLDGPWVVGTNYVDILVYNAPSSPVGSTNPYGLLLVANGTNSANMDSDNDGVNDLDDLCPCDYGTNSVGCPDPVANTCDIELIRSTFLGAGCLELPLCYSNCSMYFLNPSPNSGSSAQAFAQLYGANLISVQDVQENECIINELNRINEAGVIWIGFNDEAQEGNFVWYDQAPITYTNWAPGEPNNSGGNEGCTQIYPDGLWNDLNCNTANAKSIIEVNLCPVISTPDVIVCSDETTVIAAADPILGSNPYTYSWDNGATTQSQTVPTTDATYIVTVTDRYSCSGTDTCDVITKPVPTATVTPTTDLICSGEATDFQVASNLAGTTFDWTVSGTGTNGSTNGTGNAITQTLTTTGATNGSATYSITPELDGCFGTPVTATVTVSALPVLTFTPPAATICNGDTQSITVSGANTYDWSPSTGLNTTTGNTVSASPTSSETYTVTGTNVDGCESVNSVNITVNPVPQIQVTPTQQSFCVSGTTNFQLTSVPAGASFNWVATPTNIIGSSSGSGTTISQALTASGTGGSVTYAITGTLNGCQSSVVTAVANVNNETNLTDNVQICNYELPLSWNGQTITTGGAAVATHTTQDANGCDVTTTLNLTVTTPPTVTFIAQAEDCLPAEVTLTPSSVVPNGNCIWYVNGQAVTGDCSGAVFTETNSGCQDVSFVATDANGCTTTVNQNDSYCIEVLPDAQFSLTQQSNITVQTVNGSTNATNYVWVLPNGSTTTVFDPTVLFEQLDVPSVITLYAYSANGCYDSMTMVIEWPFVVPNVITANGDGVNDYFIIAGLAPNSKLIILNRWGNVVYTSDNYNNNWDGRDKSGLYVTGGVYTYVLELPDGNKQHGFVHVEGR